MQSKFERLLAISGRIYSQRRIRAEGDVPKIYSAHAPEVSCMAICKTHKTYKCGHKVSMVSTGRDTVSVGVKSLAGITLDWLALKEVAPQN